MIRVGVVEDDPASAQLLAGYLQRFERETGEPAQVARFANGLALLANYRPDFDLLLVDIQMPGLDGFSAAERIRAVDQRVMIVFVTATPQYAVRGYEVDALSYLVKPVTYTAFARDLTRCVERMRRRGSDWLVVATPGGVARLDTAEVVYLESDKHRVVIHTNGDSLSVAGALKNFDEELAGKGFFRCNSGYLVNLRHVLAVRDGVCHMTGGHRLIISRPRKKAFMAALTDYVSGWGRD